MNWAIDTQSYVVIVNIFFRTGSLHQKKPRSAYEV